MDEQVESTPGIAPSNTDIVAQAIESFETPAQSEPAETAPTPAPVEELSAEEKFLLEQGHKMRKDDGRDVWLPAKTVAGMLKRYGDRSLDTHKSKWEGEHGVTKRELEQARADIASMADSIRGDPHQFLQFIAQHDPRYQVFLGQQQAKADDDPEPALILDQGNDAYVKSFKDHAAWVQRDTMRKWKADMDKAAKEQQQKANEERARQERVQGQMSWLTSQAIFGSFHQDGQTLSPFQQKVLDLMREDKSLTPKEAFYIAKDGWDEGKRDPIEVRKEVIKDINEAPKSTSVARSAGDAAPRNAKRTNQEIVAAAIANAEKKA